MWDKNVTHQSLALKKQQINPQAIIFFYQISPQPLFFFIKLVPNKGPI